MDEKHFDAEASQIGGEPTGDGKKVFIKTYGCQMNVYDTERMTDALAPKGYQATQDAEDADLILLNTCHIREKAAEKVYSELGRMRQIKQAKADVGRDVMIGVAGCVAQAEGEEIMARAPVVDLVFGPQAYHRLPELVERAKEKQHPVDTDFPLEDKFDHMPKRQAKQVQARGVTAFLTVQEGCDKFCTFCVVPYTRGAEVSRPVVGLMDEAKQLAAAGVREITLLGQNVNAYHGDDGKGGTVSLAGLMEQLSEIEGLDRLRYTTSHPRDMDMDLILAHRDNPKVMPYLHLPVQAGSDKILKAMNRTHTGDEYRALIDKIRDHRPDLALSGDFIVGFPGETDEDFEDTLQLVRDVEYAQAYSFKYSPRPGTPSAELGDQVPREVADVRLQALQALINEQQTAFNAKMMGRKIDVLFDKKGREPGQLSGRSPYLQAVQVDAPESLIGTIKQVRVVKVGKNSLFGELV